MMLLPKFNMVTGFVIDYMLGVKCLFVTMRFDSSAEAAVRKTFATSLKFSERQANDIRIERAHRTGEENTRVSRRPSLWKSSHTKIATPLCRQLEKRSSTNVDPPVEITWTPRRLPMQTFWSWLNENADKENWLSEGQMFNDVTPFGGNFCIGILRSFYFVVYLYLCGIYFAGSVD